MAETCSPSESTLNRVSSFLLIALHELLLSNEELCPTEQPGAMFGHPLINVISLCNAGSDSGVCSGHDSVSNSGVWSGHNYGSDSGVLLCHSQSAAGVPTILSKAS